MEYVTLPASFICYSNGFLSFRHTVGASDNFIYMKGGFQKKQQCVIDNSAAAMFDSAQTKTLNVPCAVCDH